MKLNIHSVCPNRSDGLSAAVCSRPEALEYAGEVTTVGGNIANLHAKTFSALLAAIVVCLSDPFSTGAQEAPALVKTFTSKKLGFEISYPTTWGAQQREATHFFIRRLFPPKGAASFSIVVAHYSGDKKELANALNGKSDTMLTNMVSFARERFPDFRILAHKPTVLGNFPAYMIQGAYSLNNPTSSIRAKNIMILGSHGDYLYRINFEATEADFAAARKDFDIILTTFNYQ
jgi:hypothetical protein